MHLLLSLFSVSLFRTRRSAARRSLTLNPDTVDLLDDQYSTGKYVP